MAGTPFPTSAKFRLSVSFWAKPHRPEPEWTTDDSPVSSVARLKPTSEEANNPKVKSQISQQTNQTKQPNTKQTNRSFFPSFLLFFLFVYPVLPGFARSPHSLSRPLTRNIPLAQHLHTFLYSFVPPLLSCHTSSCPTFNEIQHCTVPRTW